MPTDISRNRKPAPVVQDARLPIAYDLCRGDQLIKLPYRSPVSSLTIIRFTMPNARHPNGQLILAGHAPVDPSVLGMSLVRRY